MQEITLKAGAAFGNGAHESTRLALAALELVQSKNPDIKSVLDMGCGSGILSLAAAHFWPRASILACDIEETAITTAEENIFINKLNDTVKAIRSDGYSHSEISGKAPFDLVIANIVAEILTKQVPALSKHLSDRSTVILSGILVWLLEPVLVAHEAIGLKPSHTLALGDWRCVVLRKSLD